MITSSVKQFLIPAVGAIEAISAMETFTRPKKTTTTIYMYKRPAGPPLGRPKMRVLSKSVKSSAREGRVEDEPEQGLPRIHQNHGKSKDGQEIEISLQEVSATSQGDSWLSGHTLNSCSLPIRFMSSTSLTVPFFSPTTVSRVSSPS